MSIRKVYRDFLAKLQSIYDLGEATVIADWTFEHLLHITRADLIKSGQQAITDASYRQIQLALQELLLHKPVQYVLGHAWFYHLKLKVNEQVLIPRPETEELVETIISTSRSQLPKPKILDIGTGSGCIAIALKKNMPEAALTTIDISIGALAIAKENAALHQTEIDFIQLDFLEEPHWSPLPSFDLIVSNPPYIPQQEKAQLNKNVTAYEPASALFVPDERPLLFYEKIARFGKTHLNTQGKIIVEIHETLSEATAAVFRELYDQVEVKKDIFGKNRILLVTSRNRS